MVAKLNRAIMPGSLIFILEKHGLVSRPAQEAAWIIAGLFDAVITARYHSSLGCAQPRQAQFIRGGLLAVSVSERARGLVQVPLALLVLFHVCVALSHCETHLRLVMITSRIQRSSPVSLVCKSSVSSPGYSMLIYDPRHWYVILLSPRH